MISRFRLLNFSGWLQIPNRQMTVLTWRTSTPCPEKQRKVVWEKRCWIRFANILGNYFVCVFWRVGLQNHILIVYTISSQKDIINSINLTIWNNTVKSSYLPAGFSLEKMRFELVSPFHLFICRDSDSHPPKNDVFFIQVQESIYNSVGDITIYTHNFRILFEPFSIF